VPERLRIAQLAPIASPVGPDVGDSIGQLVSMLSEGLAARGHDVTLFATGDSATSARLEAAYPRGYEADAGLWDWEFHEVMHAAIALEQAHRFDVVHSHAYHYALPFARFVTTPIVHSHHVWMAPDVAASWRRGRTGHLVALSHAQRRALGMAGHVPVTVIHHGIDTAAFRFQPRGGEYLAFLGRMIPEKGPVTAIEVARRVGMPIVLAGPRDDPDDYFRACVAPSVDGTRVRYLGPVGAAERNRLLGGAAALLYPIADPEPFGLVMVEAMACGTPVAAIGLGAVPEIVEPGLTGYHAADAAGLADRVAATARLDRAAVRGRATARFDHRHMIDRHERLYRRVAAARRGARATPRSGTAARRLRAER
jgi:glycosyltransferase involved in cell wall biosynthesis